DHCLVIDEEKIRCGVDAISGSECEAINCCFDGHTCFYGNAVTVQCTKDAQMIVVVARDATLPHIIFTSIKFLAEDERCNPVGLTSAFAIYQFPVSACGTVLTEEYGVLIYENKMSSSFDVTSGPVGLITRDSDFELLMQCRYIGTSVKAVVVEVGVAPAPQPVAALGPLDVELRLANGQCINKGCVEAEEIVYSSFYVDADYPVTKVLRGPVYVEVRMLHRTDPNLILTLGRCWATSSPDPYSHPQWDLLTDGCPYSDDRYQTTLLSMHTTTQVQYPTHHKRFVFKMFSFVMPTIIPKGPTSGAKIYSHLKEKVTIHCDTAVCIPSLGYDCQPRCHRKGRDVAASGRVASGEETVMVSSKEVVIIDPRASL
ncbi:zona pellucida sperm-binding protein 4-like, partial [Clinocottus analis]|uniref:zona pellucida sperm-binding protein 4-like n=1 Tax=Clinocottus analis TaxID=304258 RepID=UPI0035C09452